jgi:hypothetical protein
MCHVDPPMLDDGFAFWMEKQARIRLSELKKPRRERGEP